MVSTGEPQRLLTVATNWCLSVLGGIKDSSVDLSEMSPENSLNGTPPPLQAARAVFVLAFAAKYLILLFPVRQHHVHKFATIIRSIHQKCPQKTV